MKEYATRDIANICDLAPATVRKYAQKLEAAGHLFTKDDKGFRIFVDSDIELFKKMKEMSNDTGMNVESIAVKLVKQPNDDTEEAIQTESEVATPMPKDDSIQSDARYEALMNEIQSLKELIVAQQKYMDQRLEQHLKERDQRLTESIRQLQEFKQSLIEAAAVEEKKKPWWKVWGK